MNSRQSIRNSFYLKTNTVTWKKRARLKKLQCRPHRRLDMRNLYTHINRSQEESGVYISQQLSCFPKVKMRCSNGTDCYFFQECTPDPRCDSSDPIDFRTFNSTAEFQFLQQASSFFVCQLWFYQSPFISKTVLCLIFS